MAKMNNENPCLTVMKSHNKNNTKITYYTAILKILHLTVLSSALIDWVKVLRPTWHKIGHFGDVPQANLLAWYGKTKLSQQKHTFTNQKNVLEHKINTKKLRSGLVVSYHIWTGNGRGPILVSALYKSVTYLLRYLPTSLQPWTHTE